MLPMMMGQSMEEQGQMVQNGDQALLPSASMLSDMSHISAVHSTQRKLGAWSWAELAGVCGRPL